MRRPAVPQGRRPSRAAGCPPSTTPTLSTCAPRGKLQSLQPPSPPLPAPERPLTSSLPPIAPLQRLLGSNPAAQPRYPVRERRSDERRSCRRRARRRPRHRSCPLHAGLLRRRHHRPLLQPRAGLRPLQPRRCAGRRTGGGGDQGRAGGRKARARPSPRFHAGCIRRAAVGRLACWPPVGSRSRARSDSASAAWRERSHPCCPP